MAAGAAADDSRASRGLPSRRAASKIFAMSHSVRWEPVFIPSSSGKNTIGRIAGRHQEFSDALEGKT
jgi:hypothetical protein